MQKFFSILLSTLVLMFLTGTFFMHYESLFTTRIVLIVFIILYVMIEVKQDYFSKNKKTFTWMGILSIVFVIGSVLIDSTLEKNIVNYRLFFIPLYVLILIMISYKDLYDTPK